MQETSKSCRLCLSESEFNVSLFGNFSRKINLIDKILVCLKIDVEETDVLKTICYKCTEKIESYYNFITYIRKSQTRFVEKQRQNIESSFLKRRILSSHVHEEVYNADYTFSFFDIPDEKKSEKKPSSSFFSYFSPPNEVVNRSENYSWKTPQNMVLEKDEQKRPKKRHNSEKPRHLSRDLFESQSQDTKESTTFDWRLTPDDNIMKRIRDKCFERSEF